MLDLPFLPSDAMMISHYFLQFLNIEISILFYCYGLMDEDFKHHLNYLLLLELYLACLMVRLVNLR